MSEQAVDFQARVEKLRLSVMPHMKHVGKLKLECYPGNVERGESSALYLKYTWEGLTSAVEGKNREYEIQEAIPLLCATTQINPLVLSGIITERIKHTLTNLEALHEAAKATKQ